MEKLTKPISYDKFGRMDYHPDFHGRNGLLWTQEELQYLIDYYDFAGPEEISLALERTIKTVQAKAAVLRKEGLLPPVKNKKYARRAYKEKRCH